MPAALAHAGALFELETTNHYGGSTETERHVFAAEGKNIKMDSAQGAGSSDPDQIIYRGDRREMLVIDNDERSYMVMDQEAIAAMRRMMGGGGEGGGGSGGMEAMIQEALKNVPEEQRAAVEQMMREQMQAQMPSGSGAPEGVQKVEYRETDEREEQAGYPTTKYEAVQGGEVIRELWITDWDNVDGGDEARDAFRAMAEFWGEAFGDLPGMQEENPIEIFEKADGFPVLVREFSNGQLESESVLKSATERDFEPADFEPPAGYAQQQMGM
ncbi:MAG: hypothetical protein AB7P52_03450 [Alphaproteobacteria bacterium]